MIVLIAWQSYEKDKKRKIESEKERLAKGLIKHVDEYGLELWLTPDELEKMKPRAEKEQVSIEKSVAYAIFSRSIEGNEVKLTVEESKNKDVGKGIARIDQLTMQKLCISAGDVIEIVGKRTTSAIAWPAHSRDQNRNIIRIDGFTRKNAEVGLHEYVTIRKALVQNAAGIVLAPINTKLNVDEDFTNFVKERIMGRTLVEGDITPVMMLGHAIPFRVIRTYPKGIVQVSSETVLKVLNELPKQINENDSPHLRGVS